MILYDSPLRFPGTGDQEISKESSWHKGEGKQPSQLLSENTLGEMHPEVAFAPTGCGDLQWAELLSFCSLCRDLEGAAGQSIAGGRGECLKVKAESAAEVTWEKCEKIDTWADEHGQLLTSASHLLACYLVFFHCPSHHLPPFWAPCFGL